MPTRSSVKLMSLLAAGFMAATALTATVAVTTPYAVHAEVTVPGAPVGSFSTLVEQVMPAVISVQTKYAAANMGEMMPDMPGMPEGNPFRRFFEDRPGVPDMMPRRGAGAGSGFIITADGYAVTNNHVVRGADEVTVTLNDGSEHKAKVIGVDSKTDLALIKIDGDKPFKFVKFADSMPKVGDWVVAVGNPFGLGGTVTTGIVSAINRDIGSGPYDDYMQIDASINKGNSGGPAFNLNGEVVGINTAIYSPSGGSVGIGFAIPAAMAEEVVQSLKSGGVVERGWLGVRIQPVTADIAESLGLDEASGAIVSEVTENSPALKGGLKTGDTILTLNGETVKDARSLSRMVAKVKPGQTADIEIMRDGKEETLKVEIGAMPLDKEASAAVAAPEKTNLSGLGLRLAPAEDGAGVSVVEVTPGSAAEESGIRPGDTILEIAGADVQTPADVTAALKAGTRKGKVLFLVKSGEGQRFIALPADQG